MEIANCKIVHLTSSHDFSCFECGDSDLDDFIKTDSFEYQQKMIARTFVLMRKNEAIGFHSVTMDSLKKKRILTSEEFDITNYPALKIARLAVDKTCHKHGYGELLLLHAIRLAQRLEGDVGCRLVTVDSKKEAVDFYIKHNFKLINNSETQTYPTLYLDLLTLQKVAN